MRVISGKYKGRKIEGYNLNGTRPTMDRVKESLFGMIQLNIKNSTCLDLFAGSGALGIEALSNGAKACYFVDTNKEVMTILEKNITNMEIKDEYYLLKSDFQAALQKSSEQKIKYDIIFLDPPYQQNMINVCLKLIHTYDLLNTDGIIVCEYEEELIKNPNYEVTKERSYGSKNIKILKRSQ